MCLCALVHEFLFVHVWVCLRAKQCASALPGKGVRAVVHGKGADEIREVVDLPKQAPSEQRVVTHDLLSSIAFPCEAPVWSRHGQHTDTI